MGMIIYNGVNTIDLGIVVETFPDREYPERDVEFVHIPGRNGDVVQDLGSYKNTTRSYNIAILATKREPFQEAAAKISKWLHSGIGYCRLEDSYEPEVYRMAAYIEGSSVTSLLREAGRVTINFNCKPQRYLKLGEKAITITGNYQIENPTDEYAKPLLKIIAGNSGSSKMVTINGTTITLAPTLTGTIYVDCEEKVCYYINNNSIISCDENITLSPDDFPVLNPGSNNISYDNGISSLEITPRWYII